MSTPVKVQSNPPELSVEVTPGSLVFVSYYDAKNNIVNTLGRVLSIGTLDVEGASEDGWPSLTIAVPSSNADPRLLSGPRWHEQFTRLTGVRHVSHESHASRSQVAAWKELDIPDEHYPQLLDRRPAPPENPAYTRDGIEKPQVVSIDQAAAVQSGKAPTGTKISPAINEPEEAGSGTGRYEPSDWTQATGEGLDYPGAAAVTGPTIIEKTSLATDPVIEEPATQHEAAGEEIKPDVEQSS